MSSFNFAGVGEEGGRAGCQPTHVGFWGSRHAAGMMVLCLSEVRASQAGEGTDSSKMRWRCERGPCSETLEVSLFPLHALLIRANE